MSRSLIFWMGLVASILAGIYGLYINRPIIYIPYGLINPALFILLTRTNAFSPIRKKLELLGAFALLLNIPGTLYLHSLPIQYDIPLHFFIGWIVFEGLSLIFPILFKRKIGYPILVGTVFLGGLLFEGFQNGLDILVGTNLATDLIQPKWLDFLFDITMNALGALAGAFIKTASKPASSQSEPTYRDHA